MNKTEALTQAVRRSLGIRLREEADIIQGEVVELEINIATDDKTQFTGKITLKTTDMEALYELGNRMIQEIKEKKITTGDVISINKVSGKITKLGRSYQRSKDYDAVSNDTRYIMVF